MKAWKWVIPAGLLLGCLIYKYWHVMAEILGYGLLIGMGALLFGVAFAERDPNDY